MIIGEKPQNSEIQIVFVLLGEVTKKNFTTVVNYGGGQQILVCEPQKSAFFRANFPKKKHAEINS